MEKKELALNNPVAVGAVTLIPIVEVQLNYWCRNSHASFWSVKQPVAVAIASPSAKRASRITGEEVPLDQFIQDVPGIEEILAGI